MLELIYNYAGQFYPVVLVVLGLIAGAFCTWAVSMFYSVDGVVSINEYHPLYWYRYSLMAPTSVLKVFAMTLTNSFPYYKWVDFFKNVHENTTEYCESSYSLCGMYWQQIFSLCIILPINLLILLPLAIIAAIIVGTVLTIGGIFYYTGIFVWNILKFISTKISKILGKIVDFLEVYIDKYQKIQDQKNAAKYQQLPLVKKIDSKIRDNSFIKEYDLFSGTYLKLTDLISQIKLYLDGDKKAESIENIHRMIMNNNRLSLLCEIDSRVEKIYSKIRKFFISELKSTQIKKDYTSVILDFCNIIQTENFDIIVDNHLAAYKKQLDDIKQKQQQAEELRKYKKELWKKRYETAKKIYQGFLCPKIVYKK